MSNHPDIAVIGGGIIGLACSLRMAQRGAVVHLFERDRCGSGSSNASLGVLSPPSPLGRRDFQRLHRCSLAMWPSFAEELLDASGIHCGYNRCGSLEILPTIDQFKQAAREVEILKTHCEIRDDTPALQLLSQAELVKLEPGIRTSEFGALFSPSSACISVAKVMSAAFIAARKAGVVIHEDHPVNLALPSENQMELWSNGGKISAGAVLVAGGAWSSLMHPILARCSPIIPVRGQALKLNRGTECLKQIVKWKGAYIVPSNESFYLGSTTEKGVGFEVYPTPSGICEILSKLLEILPRIGTLEIAKSWAGLRPAGSDGKPYIGAVPEHKNMFVAAGHYKIGFGLTPVTASAIAELICEGKEQEGLAALRPGRST